MTTQMGDNMNNEQLRAYVERIESVEEDIKGLTDDRKDLYTEVKAAGFDAKHVRYVVKMRALDKTAREELLAMQDTYLRAFGLA